ncbi:UNVERIFIED_CONTAM: hypothetical protein RMT77_014399 [Armadillidium vulgare]
MFHSSNGNIEDVNNIYDFLTLLKIKWDLFFGLAQNHIDSRPSDPTKPDMLPSKEDTSLVHDYLSKTFKYLDSKKTSEWTSNDFDLARREVVCKVTFLNSRRGNEVARLTLKKWEEAENDMWIDKYAVKTIEKKL